MVDELPPFFEQRLHRLELCAGISPASLTISNPQMLSHATSLVAITSSRLGRDPQLHLCVCRLLSRRMLELRHRQANVLVAAGSAIEPLVTRAAELFHVPVTTLCVNSKQGRGAVTQTLHREPCIIESSDSLSRDAVTIAIADQVDGVYVRRGGTIDACLRARIQTLHDTSTRVAVIPGQPSAAMELIAAGAIGWYVSRLKCVQEAVPEPVVPTTLIHHDQDWIRSDGEWLTHTTRRCVGSWPGQSEHQYQDDLLLSGPAAGIDCEWNRGPLESLARIVRSGVIVASAITSAKQYPVVCFSEVPLVDRLRRRKFRAHLGRWDDEPYGIAIRLSAAKRIGIKPVIYGDPKDRQQLASEDRYRFQAKGTTYDWTQEREWRCAASLDLQQLDQNDVRIFVPDAAQARRLNPVADWAITVLGDTLGAMP